jgi:formamidopyrimidine-DNA glycosylase
MNGGLKLPELPSVEIFKYYFDSTSLKQNIKEVVVNNPEILVDTTTQEIQNFKSSSFISSSRYGKYLFARISKENFIVFHFGMTGFFKYHPLSEGHTSHSRISFIFENKNVLDFEDARKFGKVSISKNIPDFVERKHLGPDALKIDYKMFKKMFEGRKGNLKPLLMNQHFLAGIGNLYADEILYQSGIHPLRKANNLKKEDFSNLYENMIMVLRKAIELQDRPRNFPPEFLLYHRYPGGECPEGGKLDIIKVGGRTTYYCPGKQVL